MSETILRASRPANEFYSAAVRSGTESVKAWFFGSLDSANSITVDKPPASLWLMVAPARLFGFSSLSLLLPALRRCQALVRVSAGLLAGLFVGLTPVAALMFRFGPSALPS